MSELFNITREEAMALIGNQEIEIDPEDAPPEGPSGSLDLERLPEEFSSRLEDIFDQFTEAEEALPDFAEFDRLRTEALEDLEDLQSEVDAIDVGEEVVDDDPDSA